MFILLGIIILTVFMYFSNRSLDVGIDNMDAFNFNKEESISYGLILLVGVILQVLQSAFILFFTKYFWIIVGVYIFGSIIGMLVTFEGRKHKLTAKQEELEQVYEILQPVIDPKKKGLDYNDLPFELGYYKGELNKITIEYAPSNIGKKDDVYMNCVSQLNMFFPNFVWIGLPDGANRIYEFLGTPLPPKLANYKGSWLRPSAVIPVGLGGLGEVSWVLDSVKWSKVGRSQYQYEDGLIPELIEVPWAPQGLVSGSTGGGKSVTLGTIIKHCIQHNNEISLALVDIKKTEFFQFRGLNGVIAVAETIEEAHEILGIAREVMYLRNKQLQQVGLSKVADYEPTDKTDRVWITGREIKEYNTVLARIEGEEQQLTAEEVYEITRDKEIEVSFIEDIWIPVNHNCVDYVYNDAMPRLMIIVDEYAELTGVAGVSQEEKKLKEGITGSVQSLTQLGRSAGIHVAIATQQPKADIINTNIRSNPLSLDTRIIVDDEIYNMLGEV